jgi:DNA-binding transcriptional regulator YiaG
MTPTEFRRIMDSLGLTQTGVSSVFGISDRAIRAWLTGERGIPEPLAKLLRLVVAGKVSVDDVRDA